MQDKELRRYAQLMQELDLTGLEITENGATVRLERGSAAVAAPPVPVAVPAAPPRQEAAPARADDGLLDIRSPMVGVFYASPAENEPPFVMAGSEVKKGDVLCVIEAMKLMNEITAEQDGVIEEVCVGNNQVVDFDHILFRLRKA